MKLELPSPVLWRVESLRALELALLLIVSMTGVFPGLIQRSVMAVAMVGIIILVATMSYRRMQWNH